MTMQTVEWLSQLDWRRLFDLMHDGALIFGFTMQGIVAVVLFAALVHRGDNTAHHRRLQTLHAFCLVALGLIWLGGTGRSIYEAHSGAAIDISAQALTFLVAASLLAAVFREAVLPGLRRRKGSGQVRRLSWSRMMATSVVAALSTVSWTGLALATFVPVVAVLPIEPQVLGLCTSAAALTSVFFAAAIIGRRRRGRARAHRPDDARTGHSPGHGAAAIDDPSSTRLSLPSGSTLVQRMHEAMFPPPANENVSRPFEPPPPPPSSTRAATMSSAPPSGRTIHGPGTNTDRSGSEPSARATLADVRRACRSALISAGAVSFVTNMLMLTGPLFMLQIYDRVLTSKSLPTLTALFGLVCALFLCMGVLDFLRARLLVRIGMRLDRLLAAQVFEGVIDVAKPARQAERLQLRQDLRQVRQFVGGAGMTSLFDMPWAPVYFAIVLMLHWALGAVALVGTAVLVIFALLNEFLSRRPVEAARQLSARSERLVEAGRRSSEVLRALGMQRRYTQLWQAGHSAELLVETRAADVSGLFSVLTKTTRLLLQSAMLAMGAYLVLADQISPGVMIAASIIMSRALAPVELAIANWRGVVAARQGLARLRRELSAAEPDEVPMALPVPAGHLSLENVFAGPIGARDPVLKAIDCSIGPGDAVAVLGANGAGKSTLARVITGIWAPMRGRVTLDGAALDQWPREQLGHHIGYLPQDAQLFSGTVAENISRFDPSPQPARIIEAAEAANVHEMVLTLENGYGTRIGEGGQALSGGQRQRIALARALYGNPALVVLDEPNANLDEAGETALSEAIAGLRHRGAAVVVMTQRRKVLETVSHILVLEEGRQVSFGKRKRMARRARTAAPAQRMEA